MAVGRPLSDIVGTEAAYYLAQYTWLTLRRIVDGTFNVPQEQYHQGLLTEVSNKIYRGYQAERNWRRAAMTMKVRDRIPAECDLMIKNAPLDEHDDIVEQAYAEVVRLEDILCYSKSRENRLRRMAKRRGFRIEKSRRRNINALDYGMFALYNERSGLYIHAKPDSKYVYLIDHIELYLKGTDILPDGTPAIMDLVTPDAWDLVDLLNNWIDGSDWNQGNDDMLKASMLNVSDAIEQDPWGVSNEAV